MLRPSVQRIGPLFPILCPAKAQVVEILANVGYSQITPDVVPMGVFQDAADDPGLVERRAVTKNGADFVVRDFIVPEKYGR